jgi:hypothetical protein
MKIQYSSDRPEWSYFAWPLGGMSLMMLTAALAALHIFPTARSFGIALSVAMSVALIPSLMEVYAELRAEIP